MRTLNDPIDYERADDDWSPAVGLKRALARGAAVAGALAILVIVYTWLIPFVACVLWLRLALAFGLAWVLAGVVQRAAGMVCVHGHVLTFVLTGLVLISGHIAFAAVGVMDARGADPQYTFPMPIVQQFISANADGLVRGWGWWHPAVLLVVNLPPLAIGGGIAVWWRSQE